MSLFAKPADSSGSSLLDSAKKTLVVKKVVKVGEKTPTSTESTGGFLSGLGFKKPVVVQEKKPEPVKAIHIHDDSEDDVPVDSKASVDEFFVQAVDTARIANQNAVVIRRDESRGGNNRPGGQRPHTNNNTRPASGGNNRPRPSGNNISFAQTTYKERDKTPNTYVRPVSSAPVSGGQSSGGMRPSMPGARPPMQSNRPPMQGNRPQGTTSGYTPGGPARVIRRGDEKYEDKRVQGKSGGYFNKVDKAKALLASDAAIAAAKRASHRPKVIKDAAVSQTLTKKETIIIKDNITVKEFSEKSGIQFPLILKAMLSNKLLGGINTALDFDTVSLLGMELGVTVQREQAGANLSSVITGDLNAIVLEDMHAENKIPRAPIVTIMGHVDHGKTSLLDYIRKSNIAGGEAGGITQSIGASHIDHNGHKITFIDTPGHELFGNLRSRGAKITNIAIIVIAADDGLKPQTIESIRHAQDAGVPIIVAVTKIDKHETKFEQILGDIGAYDLIPEQRGGTVPVIGVSSKTGEGVDALLDQILFQTEVMDLQYNPDRPAVSVVIDAQKDAKQGVLTSMIVLTGTLKVGDIVVVHNMYGKVRKMIDRKGKPTRKVHGGEPVMILGITSIPSPGRVVEVVATEKEAQKRIQAITMDDEKKSTVVTSFIDQMKRNEGAVLKIVCKSNGPSSLEAMIQALGQIPLPKNVSLKVVHQAVGDFTDSDLSFGQAAGALVLGYNVSLPAVIKKKADQLKVVIKEYEVIYHLTEYIEGIMKGMVEKEYEEVQRGTLLIKGVFFKKEKMMIIGGKVIEGKVGNGMKFRTFDGIEEVGQGEITSLQRDQDSVKEVSEGYECGMKVKTSKKIEEGNTLVFYEMVEIKE